MWTSEDVQRKAALALTIVGTISALNGAYASSYEAEKNYYTDHFINTHWITCIQLFSGLAYLLQEKKYSGSACLTVTIHACSLVISFCAVIADLSNLLYLINSEGELPQNVKGGGDGRRSRMISYCAMDAVLSLTAIPLNLLIVKRVLALDRIKESRCVRLLMLGTIQVALSVFKLAAYFMEMIAIRSASKVARMLFFNYTLDEPAWTLICILCGVLCVLASGGSRLIRYTALAMTSVSILPSIFYLWLDYRWYTSIIFLPKAAPSDRDHFLPSMPLICLFGFGFVHVGVLIASMLTIFQLVTATRTRNAQPNFVRVFSVCSLLFLGLAALIFVVDLYALANQVFYRVFHGSEQKAPFLLLLCSIFAVLSINPSLASLALPACLTASLLALKSTVFLLLSYCYLVYKGYFRDQLCDLSLVAVENCSQVVTPGGVFLHTSEALIHLAAGVTALFVCGIVMRVAHLRKETAGTTDVQLRTEKCQALLRWIGVADACGALIILVGTILSFSTASDQLHPLIVIYQLLYHISMGVSLIVFPLYQICVSERIHEVPIARHALLFLNSIRFFEILTQLDYRGTGDDLNWIWKLYHIMEIMSLCGCFCSAILVIRVENQLNPEILSDDLGVIEFDNPLREDLDRATDFNEGYIQLRQEEAI